jgi:hypothetical protein
VLHEGLKLLRIVALLDPQRGAGDSGADAKARSNYKAGSAGGAFVYVLAAVSAAFAIAEGKITIAAATNSLFIETPFGNVSSKLRTHFVRYATRDVARLPQRHAILVH